MSEKFRVLFVGNSYTTRNDMPAMLKQLAAVSGRDIQVEAKVVAFGGASLAAHWNRGEVQKHLCNAKWDAVVLQDQSTRPIRFLKSMQAHVRLFVAAAKTAGARPFLYMTWARQSDTVSQSTIAQAYQQLAEETGASLVPVGLIWQAVRRLHQHLNLYEPDQSHPSPLGSYIVACAFFAALFRTTPKAHPQMPGLLSKEDLRKIHELCWNMTSQGMASRSTSTSTPSATGEPHDRSSRSPHGASPQ